MESTLSTSENPAKILAKRIVNLYASINLATAQLITVIAEFDAHNYGEQQGFFSTAHWLNYQCGIGMTAAREKVRVARALQNFPAVAQQFSNGRLSYSKVRAITRVATTENESTLVDIARHATAAQAEQIFQQYRQTVGTSEPSAELSSTHSADSSAESSAAVSLQQTAPNEFSSYWAEDGFLVFRGRLSPEQGALMLAAMQREQEEGAKRGTALAHVAERALSSNTASSPTQKPTQNQTQKQTQTRTVSSADRFQIHVEIDSSTQHIRGGPGISDKLIERLSCDASLISHQSDSQGEPLNVGRKTRTVSPVLRRALVKRDGGCRFPGCTHRHFVDAHHVKHWAHGGETKLSNLVLLCTYHHSAVHERGFRIERVFPETGMVQFKFYSPQGDYLAPVGDDLSFGQVLELQPNDSAESFESIQPDLQEHKASLAPLAPLATLAPINPTERPDYTHINWVLANFHPPSS